ncbi:PREDICTED: nuclear pore complex protein Nup50 isoform X2 [Dinoponera quadriceps]|nr:PREDICTED: nuclear pore complex protein Nup50 isoform X2 [Dinoponera quadriceps]XP_014474542.1 PREDICTED: nuclear pore complex protein Nup50 isoform X2 [Dinoponera quadriceps]XP_014474543.1 PREDICTED: nuclear pore complex protein Nup50 isoform X2 [Dinoponera quadriceps]XP_014474544.1 PREDICTED: nuclear pore complex protein Nup50 isoform X2 [Dinoponera quadriceps]XP_014474545.1 PREDICTED: nuclear pore complex protein Nup50 isoform X2 [Dinoponera quadriceps]XP_014474546.1 PREDICTED: nuclear p
MAGKRTATTELNHDNWNEEQEPEEAGTFARATTDVLRKRVLKTARRGNRGLLPEFQEGSLKSAFENFTGFSTASAKNAPFSFLAGVSTSPSAIVNTTSITTTVNTSRSIASNGAAKATESDASKTDETAKMAQMTQSGKQVSAEQATEKAEKNSSDYYTSLKGLNESVAQWINSHVDSNPFCILTPIFKDYERYLNEIVSKEESVKAQTASHPAEHATKAAPSDNKKDENAEKKKADGSLFSGNNNNANASTPKPPPPSVAAEWKPEKSVFSNIPPAKSIFGNTEQKTESPRATNTKSLFGSTDAATAAETRRPPIFGNLESNTPGKSIFSNVNTENNPFLQKPPPVAPSDSKAEEEQAKADAKPAAAPPTFPSSTFSFGQSSAASNAATAGFSFGSGKAFTFAACPVKPQEQEEKTDNDNNEEDDEEPPKPEFKPVTEEGAIYEQRCKVFVKKDGSFSDRGIGMLFLKPTPNGKTQLIVRAETALGNLLLNTLLTQSIPIKRMNKNTIMLVCLPIPDSSPPPVPVLLRVKTSETADTLFETLDKHTK